MNTSHWCCKDILLPLHRPSGGKLRQWGRCTVSSGKQSGRQTARPTQRAHVETAGRLTDQLFSSTLGFPGTGNAAQAVRAIIAVEKNTTLHPHTKNKKPFHLSVSSPSQWTQNKAAVASWFQRSRSRGWTTLIILLFDQTPNEANCLFTSLSSFPFVSLGH